jgi:hypothetical protein
VELAAPDGFDAGGLAVHVAAGLAVAAREGLALRVLELGGYVSVAYAGMILAEQGHDVTKWTLPGKDPILALDRGDELWDWINYGKTVEHRHVGLIGPGFAAVRPDVIVDNFRAEALAGWGIDPAELAERWGIPWVSIRSDVADHGGRSFDVIAQARAWGDRAPWVPFYIGDTTAGLWAAFKALSVVELGQVGHHVVFQATSLAKLVEGEDVIEVERRKAGPTPWDPDLYEMGAGGAAVAYREATVFEPRRDREWRLAHLHHNGDGRYRI